MNLIEEIEELFYPMPYTDVEDNLNGEILHYSRPVLKCKYVLIVSNMDETTNLKDLLKLKKKKLKSHYNSTLLAGVGFKAGGCPVAWRGELSIDGYVAGEGHFIVYWPHKEKPRLSDRGCRTLEQIENYNKIHIEAFK